MSRITISIFFLACVFFSCLASAAPGIRFASAPAWVVASKMAASGIDLRDVDEGYYMALFEQETNVETQQTYQRTVRHIVSDAGVQNASNIYINFNPSYEQLTIHNITVWRDGKPLDKMQKNAFKVIANEHELSMFLYNGNYTAYLILKDIRKGDKIDYAYTITGENPVFGGKFFNSFIFQATSPISQLHYLILAPSDRTFNTRYFNSAPQPVKTTANNKTTYEWNLLDMKAHASTSGSPAWYYPFPYVQISEYVNWQQVAAWAYSINTPADKLNAPLAQRLADLKTKYGSDEAGLFRAIVDIVQNEVRYMGVEIGTYSHKANDPGKVYEQRYGDCKDKSLLLVSMLRNVNIPANMALVNSYYRDRVETFIPTPAAFNHAIVQAHVLGKDVWVDPTISAQGGTGTNIYCPDYGHALLVTPGTKSLISLPVLQAGDVKYAEDYKIKDPQSPVLFTVRTTYFGNKADDMRETLPSRSRNELEKEFLDYYTKIYPHIKSLDTLVINDNKEANIIETVEHYEVPDFLEYDSARQYYVGGFYATMIKNVFPVLTNKKEGPLAVPYPYNLHYSIHVDAPLKWNIPHDEGAVTADAYKFSYDIYSDTSALDINYDLVFFKDHITVAEQPQYEKDYKKIVHESLAYNFSYTTGAGNARSSGINYWMILFILALTVFFVFAAFRIYKTPTPQGLNWYPWPKAIGGWLILPILGMIVYIGHGIYAIITSGYLKTGVWHVYDNRSEELAFKAIFLVEAIFFNLSICYAAFCLFLVYKRRDILPKHIRILFIASATYTVLDNFCAHYLLATAIDYKAIFRSLVSTAIWVPYFYRSTRVIETFVIPYPNVEQILPQEQPPRDELSSDAAEEEHGQEEAPPSLI